MKRWLLIGSAICLFAVVLFFYVSFNGNFITKALAKKKVETYVAQTYANNEARLVASGFDFKDSRYYFDYEIDHNSQTANYSFSIGGAVLLEERIYSYLSMESTDTALTESFREAGRAWLTAQLAARNLHVDLVEYNVDIPKGMYEQTITWQPNVDDHMRPVIAIELRDDAQTEAEFLQQVAAIRSMLHEGHMTYAEVQVSIYRHVQEGNHSYYDSVYTSVFTNETTKLDVL